MHDKISEVRTRRSSENTRENAVRAGCAATPLAGRDLEIVAAAGGARGGIIEAK